MLIPPWVTPGAKCRISMACECGTAMWCCLGHSYHPYIPPADLSLQHSCFIQTPRLARYRVNNGFHHPNLMILLWRWKSSASWRHPHLKQRWFSCNGLGHMLIRKGDQLELSNTPRGSTWLKPLGWWTTTPNYPHSWVLLQKKNGITQENLHLLLSWPSAIHQYHFIIRCIKSIQQIYNNRHALIVSTG